jgi:hypothetical protein
MSNLSWRFRKIRIPILTLDFGDLYSESKFMQILSAFFRNNINYEN